MRANGTHFGSPPEGPAVPEPVGEEDVRKQLERVLASPAFKASQRCRELLRYIVAMSLQGRAGELKERTIGMEVFNRPPSYDPSVDSIVRVRIGEVRRRLGLYYAQAGPEDHVRIDLPAGSYIPEFRAIPHEERVPLQPSSHRWIVAASVLLLAGAAAMAVLWRGTDRPDPTLREFWGPALHGGSPIQFTLSYVPIYWLKPSLEGTGREPKLASDFLLIRDRYVGSGDSMAMMKLAAMAHRLRMPYTPRIGEVLFQDLRSSPAVLIGYSCTRWKRLNSELRFVVQFTRQPFGVVDTKTNKQWIPPRGDQRNADEDYAIVTRVFHPDTGTLMVMLAGVEDFGTAAAADLVTDESLLAEALHGAPSDWPHKNMQLVLHTKVISGAPGSPKVLTQHFW